ncbi:MAG: WbqC family protein [bacterium]
MIAAIHQPAYLPWLGYFHKILLADVFVFLDTVQIEKNGFVNRNRVRTPSGVQWLTVPVGMKGHTGKTIAEMEISPAAGWKKKHIRTLEMAYRKSPWCERYAGPLGGLIEGAGDSLADFLFEMLAYFTAELGLSETRIVRASELAARGRREDLLLSICKEIGADTYLSGAAGKDYLDARGFEEAGVRVEFQEFRHPVYDQGRPGFEPNLAVVDALFHLGGDAVVSVLRRSGEG